MEGLSSKGLRSSNAISFIIPLLTCNNVTTEQKGLVYLWEIAMFENVCALLDNLIR